MPLTETIWPVTVGLRMIDAEFGTDRPGVVDEPTNAHVVLPLLRQRKGRFSGAPTNNDSRTS
jgi:hypothetical protein